MAPERARGMPNSSIQKNNGHSGKRCTPKLEEYGRALLSEFKNANNEMIACTINFRDAVRNMDPKSAHFCRDAYVTYQARYQERMDAAMRLEQFMLALQPDYRDSWAVLFRRYSQLDMDFTEVQKNLVNHLETLLETIKWDLLARRQKPTASVDDMMTVILEISNDANYTVGRWQLRRKIIRTSAYVLSNF